MKRCAAMQRTARDAILAVLLLASYSAAAAVAQAQAAAPQDTRAAAEAAYARAMQLFAQRTPESLREAIQTCELALPLWEKLGDRGKQAELLGGIGSGYFALGNKQKAIEYLSRALPLTQALGDKSNEAGVLLMLGFSYESTSETPKAVDACQQALQLFQSLGVKQGEASALASLGRISMTSGDRQKAIAYFTQVLPLWRALGSRGDEAVTLYSLGVLNDLRNDSRAALDFYLQALPLYQALKNSKSEAKTLLNIAEDYDALNEGVKALDFYDRAIAALAATGDSSTQATGLMKRAVLHESRGDIQKALDDFTQALSVFESTKDVPGAAVALLRIGMIHYQNGEKEKALEFDNRALQLARNLGDHALEASALMGISSVYSSLGDDDRALDYSDRAFKLTPSGKDQAADPNALYGIGVLYQSLNRNQKALECFTQALELQHDRGDRAGERRALTAIGSIYETLGDNRKALDYYLRAVELAKDVRDRQALATLLNSLARVNEGLGDNNSALDFYKRALVLRQALHDGNGESQTLFGLAKVEEKLGDLASATKHIEASLAATESLRSKIAGQELRVTFFAKAQQVYEFYIGLLMQLHHLHPDQGYAVKALEASERARDRGLLDLLSEAGGDIREGVQPDLLERERSLSRLLEDKQTALMKALNADNVDEAGALQDELTDIREKYQRAEAQIRAASPQYAALTQPQPLSSDAIRHDLLDPNTVLLEYALGGLHSYVWAVTPERVTSFELPKRADIEKAAVQLYLLITGRKPAAPGEIEKVAAEVSGMLLNPVRNELGNKRLLIVADGALQVVPFAALPAPSGQLQEPSTATPMVVEHEIVMLPSASALAVLRREAASRTQALKTLAVLADPVFDPADPRVKQGAEPGTLETAKAAPLPAPEAQVTRGFGLERLPFTRSEADEIIGLVPVDSRLEAVDFGASKETATSGRLSQYRIVHFATHGVFNSEHPEFSGIVLSLVDKNGKPEDGILRLNDLFNLKLRADLVVLSACKTGLGKEVRGEGLMGLTRGFMYAGAPRVVVSLWSVNDQATAELMLRFYRGMLGSQQLRPAAALRQAQVAMFKDQRWRSPYFWAGFVMQGEWK